MMTQTCEALSEVTTETQMLYCIEHERMVAVENGVHIEGWTYDEVKSCQFPLGYTFCPPPDEPVELTLFDGDWAAQDDPEQDEEGFWFGGGE